jgi:hypothetical protein
MQSSARAAESARLPTDQTASILAVRGVLLLVLMKVYVSYVSGKSRGCQRITSMAKSMIKKMITS